MHVDTYRSTLVDGLFVTLPVSGRSIIGLVDELSVLELDPVRCDYELPAEPDSSFARYVLTEIVSKGYAKHGPTASFEWRRRPGGARSVR